MPRVKKNITLRPGTKRELQLHAIEHGTTKNQLIVEMLALYGSGTPVTNAEPPAMTIADKLVIEPEVWEKAVARARAEGLTMPQVIERQAQRVLARG